MTDILTEFVSILVGGISSLAQGIGSGLNAMAKAAFITGEGTTSDPYKLSIFGGVIAIFAGVGLAVSLTTLVTKWVMSLGARN